MNKHWIESRRWMKQACANMLQVIRFSFLVFFIFLFFLRISGQTNQKHLSLVMLFCVTVSVGVVPVNRIWGSHLNSIIQKICLRKRWHASVRAHSPISVTIVQPSTPSVPLWITLHNQLCVMRHFINGFPLYYGPPPPMSSPTTTSCPVFHPCFSTMSHVIGWLGLLATHIYSKFNCVPR